PRSFSSAAIFERSEESCQFFHSCRHPCSRAGPAHPLSFLSIPGLFSPDRSFDRLCSADPFDLFVLCLPALSFADLFAVAADPVCPCSLRCVSDLLFSFPPSACLQAPATSDRLDIF